MGHSRERKKEKVEKKRESREKRKSTEKERLVSFSSFMIPSHDHYLRHRLMDQRCNTFIIITITWYEVYRLHSSEHWEVEERK